MTYQDRLAVVVGSPEITLTDVYFDPAEAWTTPTAIETTDVGSFGTTELVASDGTGHIIYRIESGDLFYRPFTISGGSQTSS